MAYSWRETLESTSLRSMQHEYRTYKLLQSTVAKFLPALSVQVPKQHTIFGYILKRVKYDEIHALEKSKKSLLKFNDQESLILDGQAHCLDSLM
jgi:hypothetical protein